VLIAASVTVGFRSDFGCFFLDVMTVKSSPSEISSKLGGSEDALAETRYLSVLVSPWEQCTSASTTTF
jgi:hypothetical protein